MKRIYQLYRRCIAGLLTACILIGTVGSGGAWGGITAYASTELPADNLGNGRSDGLAYKWIHSDDYSSWGGVSYRFDLKGLKAGQDSYENAGMSVTYSNWGFPTYLAMAGNGKTTPPTSSEVPNQFYNPAAKLPANYYMAKLGQRDADGNTIANYSGAYYNGAVERISFGDGSSADPRVDVESRITTTPSADGKYVLVDYYLCHVGGTLPSGGRTFWLASPFDLQVDGTLQKEVHKTNRGFYALNSANKATVDVITDDSSLGITDPVSTRWVGSFSGRNQNMFTESAEDSSTGDVSVVYSWEFKLRPYETIHRRIAFANKEAAYYVSWGSGVDVSPSSSSLAGTYKQPFKTLEYAISQCSGKNAYIFIQDYKPMDGAVELVPAGFPDKTSIVIMSSDLDRAGNSVVDRDDYIQKFSRAAGYEGPLFTQSRSAVIQFSDITIDGNGAGSSPLIQSMAGTLQINSGTTMVGNRGGGAISATGSANLYMNGAEAGTVITGNTSADGAVYFNSSGKFTVLNNVTVKDNINEDGAPANVYLPTGKNIEVDGDLGLSAIGVTTQAMPAASLEGNATEAAQEIKLAIPSAQYPSFSGASPFADNFFADLSSQGMYTSAGTTGLGNGSDTVMRRHGYALTSYYLDTDGGGSVPGKPAQTTYYSQGDAVSIDPPADITGYRLNQVSIEQGTGSTLTVQNTPGAGFGRITGTMPGQEVIVNYEYQKESSQIIFQANGGTPEPPALSGTAGSPVTALLPATSRYGYIFKGWSTVNDREHPQFISALPSVYPSTPVTYYAIFEPDPEVKFNLTVEYTDSAGNLVFQSNTIENAYSAESHIETVIKNVPNFKWSRADSHAVPGSYDYDGTGVVSVGSFQAATGIFSGTMPAMDVVVRYVFQKDSAQPQQKILTNGYLNNGYGDWDSFDKENIDWSKLIGDSRFDQPMRDEFPGEEITIQPKNVYGYKVVYGFISGGDDSFERGIMESENPADWPMSDRFLVFGGSGSFDSEWNFTGWMPNQQFDIAYVYEPTGEGYEFTTSYLDSGTHDDRLKNIIVPLVESHTAEEAVRREYEEQYGYHLSGKSFEPSSAPVSWQDVTTLEGRMPNDNLALTYTHNRDSSKWADITYKAGQKGSLQGGEGVSPDVQSLSGGSFKASILINDGTTEGREKSYTLAQIKEKRLMPVPQAENQYYRFGGWFIDTDNNGILDGDETILPQDYRFDGPATVTASFGENPDAWINITFEAGEHGSINAGEMLSLRTTFDQKWGDIQASLPSYTPEVNYLVDDWYVQGEPLEADTPLVNGQTYTIQFYPDPAIFGTDVSEPEAMTGLNGQGKGRITVFGTTLGYKYILTDLNGEVLAVNKGNILTSRTIFDNLYPGMRYLVYEATGRTAAAVGDMIGDIGGTVSGGTEVLTPVVETNYQIYYDEEDEGKTQLSIKPADQASDYAVLDSAGNPVHTPQTGGGGWQKPSGNPGELIFTGLDYNKEYTVVARPTGRTEITAESRRPDGSVITTDPGGELELPTYIIETLNGEIKSVAGEAIGAGRYEEAHKGDQVEITADPVNGAGRPFSHWTFTIGSVKGMGTRINTREASFTMPDTNLVLTAVYERAATPSNAKVIDEVRGGSREELALDPNEIPDLENDLTTDGDRELLDVNHADVTYKVVYRKNAVRASESNAIKAGGDYDMDHEAAFKGAWGLDVSIERYVNGRRVTRASASNASFNTYVQLEKGDIDMMDYQLYEISEDPDDGTTVNLVPMDYDPEETGGLFSFRATEGCRYVMVYNRAYRLYFLNNTAPTESRYRYFFKVRRSEAPSDAYYSGEYGNVEEQLDYFINPDGAEFSYVGWSYRQDKLRDFDPDRKITRKTYVYAYYEDNVKEVDDTRKKLEEAIQAAIGISDDHFLKLNESKKLKEYIEAALEVLDQESPKATIGQLEAALEELKDRTAPYKDLLDDRYDHYDDIQDNGNKGGSKGGGGGGGGTKKAPFNGTAPGSYQIGTNGNWIESTGPAGERQLSFRLNGGDLLSGMWAHLKYPEGAQAAGNGWYRFDTKGIMQSGWITDEAGNWYYCNTEPEGYTGKMATDWKLDGSDGNWYYLDPSSGVMALGWKQLGGKWYYFSPTGAGVYAYDPAKEKWTFGGGSGRPLGSMYKNEMTPDGYQVGADGAWIQ